MVENAAKNPSFQEDSRETTGFGFFVGSQRYSCTRDLRRTRIMRSKRCART